MAQTSAICTPDFAWMQNQRMQSPCLLAAYGLGSCQSGQQVVPALQPGNTYNRPNATIKTANKCSCSWTVYNLLSACTICQTRPDALSNWSSWVSDCAQDLVSNTFWPPSIIFPEGETIPSWATTDPTTWPNARFNANTAKGFAAQGKDDVVPNAKPSAKSSGTPVGPIVGGVIGGLAVVAIAIVVALIMRRQRRQQLRKAAELVPAINETSTPYADQTSGHGRSFSDSSMQMMAVPGFGYTPLLPSSPSIGATLPPISPVTMHTHNNSIHSVSILNSPISTPPPMGRMTSPTPTATAPFRNTEDIIHPFTLPSQHPQDRKGADGVVYPVYDPPTRPPEVVNPSSDGTTTRGRLNPPPYSSYPSQRTEVLVSTPLRPEKAPHTKKPSLNTERSWEPSRQGRAVGGGDGSISTIDDVVGRMGIAATSAGASGSGRVGNTVGTGFGGHLFSPSTQITNVQISNPDEPTSGRVEI